MTDNPYATPEHLDKQPIPEKKRAFSWLWLFLTLLIGAILFALLVPANRSAGPAVLRAECQNNLKQIAIALYNYEGTYGSLPPAYTVDTSGRPLHSWRTLILPFLEQESLYKSIDLNKPWDHPVNAKARQTNLAAYRCPGTHSPTATTTYLASVAPDGCFRAAEPRKLSEITDQHGQTIAVIEVADDRAVEWMSPLDADAAAILNRGQDPAKLAHAGGTLAAFADGSVHFLKYTEKPENLRALISIAGKENMLDLP